MKKLLICLAVMTLLFAVPALADTVYEDVVLDIPETFQEAPTLTEKVEAGELPPVEERLPSEPLVVQPLESVGEYGGTLYEYAPSTDGFDDLHWTRRNNWMRSADDTYYYDGDLNYAPYRIKGITVNDDMTEYTIHMREGIKWSDGVDCTIDDLIWTFDNIWNNEELGVKVTVWPDNRPTCERMDDYTLKLIFPAPCTDFLAKACSNYTDLGASWGFSEIPAHYMEQFHMGFNPDADKNAKEAGYEDWTDMFWDMCNGGGNDQINLDLPTLNAWVLVERTTTRNVWERNPYYFAVDTQGNQLPYIDRIVVEAVSDSEVAKIKLLAGEFDLQDVFLTELSDYALLKQNEESGNYTVKLNTNSTTAKPMLAFNLNHKDAALREVFNTAKFRQAMSIAIDREEINEIVFQGLGTGMQDVYLLSDYVDSTEWAYAWTEYDPEKAGEMLDELGMTVGEDGWRTLPDGSPFAFTLQTISEEGWASTVELVAAQWQKIGVNVTYSVVDRTLFSERNSANELDVWVWHDGIMTELSAYSSWGQWALNEKAWGWYYTLKGTENELAEEVPEEWREYYADVEAMMSSAYGSEEYQELVKKVWDFRIDQLYCIGTVGNYPAPLVVKNGLENVGNHEVPFDYWLGQWAEQMWWSDADRRAE